MVYLLNELDCSIFVSFVHNHIYFNKTIVGCQRISVYTAKLLYIHYIDEIFIPFGCY